MNLDPAASILATGSAAEVDDFITCDRCVIVDWRGEPEEVIEAFQSFLPEGFLHAEFPDLEHAVLRVGSRTETEALASNLPGIPFAESVRRMVAPEHPAWLFRDSLGSDTACYFVRPAVWWRDFRAAWPERFDTLFTSAEHS